jgi:hypothetical protein
MRAEWHPFAWGSRTIPAPDKHAPRCRARHTITSDGEGAEVAAADTVHRGDGQLGPTVGSV